MITEQWKDVRESPRLGCWVVIVYMLLEREAQGHGGPLTWKIRFEDVVKMEKDNKSLAKVIENFTDSHSNVVGT